MHDEGTLQALTGGLKVKVRVQHPKILEAKFREGWMWFFRYYADEVQADGSVKTIRKKHAVGLSRGDGKITKKEGEVERDKFLAKLNAPTVEAAVEQVAPTGVVLLGEVARMYKEGYLSREKQLARPTREKQTYYLEQLIVPKWGAFRLNQIRPQAVEDWLHGTFDAWWTMYSVRAIMSRLYYYAEGYGLWEEGRAARPVGRSSEEALQIRAPYPFLRRDCPGASSVGRAYLSGHRNVYCHRRADLRSTRPSMAACEHGCSNRQDRAARLAPGSRSAKD